MYDMLWEKVDGLAGKIFEKKHLKQPFSSDKNRHHLIWEDLEAKSLTPSQLLGYSLLEIFNDGYKHPSVFMFLFVEMRFTQYDRSQFVSDRLCIFCK